VKDGKMEERVTVFICSFHGANLLWTPESNVPQRSRQPYGVAFVWLVPGPLSGRHSR
jgi:hypothetical protein